MFCQETVLQKLEREHMPPFLKGRVFNNHSARRRFGQPAAAPVRMFVDEESVIEFCACCFNAMDSFSRARMLYKCRVIINVIAATESLACASDQGTYCEQ